MALIYRSLLNIDSPSFVGEAPALVEEWLRWKLADDDLAVGEAGTATGTGAEAGWTSARDDRFAVFRTYVYEERTETSEQVRTTFTAFSDGPTSWALTDIERWATSAEAEPWIPLAPSIVTTLLDRAPCRRGQLRLPRHLQQVDAAGAPELLKAITDPTREIPIVVVSANPREDMAAARRRAGEVAKSLAGVAPVFLLGTGAVSAFSKAALDVFGDGMDVYGGAIRTYAPGAGGENDSPYRHRMATFRRFERRPPVVAARLVAGPILARSAETPPPPIWREHVRPLLEQTIGADNEIVALYAEESEKLDADLKALRDEHDELEQRIALEQADNVELMTEADRLRARVRYLQAELAVHDGAAAYADVAEEPFDAVFCSEVVDEAQKRLTRLVFADSVRIEAKKLDVHAEEAWARKAWTAFQALDAYAVAKEEGFAGDFLAYCDAATDGAKVPRSWIGRHESQMTMSNARFRDLRTLPVAVEVDESGRILMEQHIKVAQGGTPSPRIHFHDDTGGETKKIHIGWFGDHLDSRGKS